MSEHEKNSKKECVAVIVIRVIFLLLGLRERRLGKRFTLKTKNGVVQNHFTGSA